ncbi:hypothetical protein [Kitasatospora sp. NPDC057936]|uniref:hypothetical protein n=1 Tax=Kitasatospora sp. NPDC057936 TaxID=3346283 RepID=UPI0036D8A5F7
MTLNFPSGHNSTLRAECHETGLDRRELGDASKVIESALGYLLGAEQTNVVPGAE